MEISTLIQNPINLLTLIAVSILVIERLITGGWLSILIGKKITHDSESEKKLPIDTDTIFDMMTTVGIRMGILEQHFNHETTEQFKLMLESQRDVLEILRRIERDGIRVRQ